MTNRFMKVARLLSGFLGGIVGCLFIGYLNWLVIRGWFGGIGPANLGSIEVSYVSMGRFLIDYGWKSWAPFWYFGFPFHLFYTPLLPILEWLMHGVWGTELWTAYRFITGWAYVLGPISVFFLGWVLSRRWVGGFVSGVLYSIVPSLFYFLLPPFRNSPVGEVAADRISSAFWEPRRFNVLVRWGEGPHTLSLVFLPLAVAFFVLALRKESFWNLVLAAVFLALTGLANALGLMGALLFLAATAFSYHARKPKRRGWTVKSMLLLLGMWLGISSFWYNLSFLTNFFGEGGNSLGIYLSLFPWGWLLILFCLGILYLATRVLFRDAGFASALIWFVGLFSVVYVYYFSAPQELSKQRIELLPQALRFIIQVDMALSVMIGVFVAWVLRVLGKRLVMIEHLLTVVVVLVALYSYIYVQPFLSKSYAAASNSVDISKTQEKVIAGWLALNVDPKKGERVFLPGNYGFYLNWFSDVWQHRGGLFQAATHKWAEHIHYQLVNGKDAMIAKAWFKVMNAKYAVITAAGSAELYKEVKNFDRFVGLAQAQKYGGDIIYEVPLKRPSLAKPVSEIEMEELPVIRKADDKEALLAYASWVEGSSENEADFVMIDHDNYEISGVVDSGEVLLVQMTADPGWKAVNKQTGKKVRVGEDPLGFLVLYPEPGEVQLVLKHGRIWQEWLGYMTTVVTVGFILWYGFKSSKQQATRNE